MGYINGAKKAGRVIGFVRFLSAVELTPEWQDRFLDFAVSRGIQDLEPYESALLGISQNSSQIILLMLENKMVGIDRLYDVAVGMSSDCQTEYYQAVKRFGVKSNEATMVFDRCINGGNAAPNLFNFDKQ